MSRLRCENMQRWFPCSTLARPGVLTPPAALQHCSTAEEECPCLQCLQRDHSPHPRRVLISLLVTRRLWWRWCSQGGDNVPVWHSSGGQVAGGSQAKCNLVWSFLSHGPRAGAGMHRALRHRHTSHQHCHVSRVMSHSGLWCAMCTETKLPRVTVLMRDSLHP